VVGRVENKLCGLCPSFYFEKYLAAKVRMRTSKRLHRVFGSYNMWALVSYLSTPYLGEDTKNLNVPLASTFSGAQVCQLRLYVLGSDSRVKEATSSYDGKHVRHEDSFD
jgi:hypothetical protein